MHMIIKILVFAGDEEEAVDEAHTVLENLCGDDRPFDYFNTFDGGSATERWGELPEAVRVCGDFGTEKCNECNERFHCYTTQMNAMIKEAMEDTKQSFIDNLTRIKEYITTHTDDQLFEESWFKFRCNQVGQDAGPCVWLYDQDGEGIRNTEHLNHVLNKWNDDGLAKKNLYVVPADVHY